MESIDQSLQSQTLDNTINDLPDEVLEFILSFLPPYKDLQNCMCVCKRWLDCTQRVMRNTSMKLTKAVAEFKVLWSNITPTDLTPTITKRFSHSACVHENAMYIFGGCTTNATAFNDLWKFDLSHRQWIRPLATGTYPVPKAYTSMVCYKDNLVLFGGWTYPSPSQYYRNVTMYNEIHFYNITSNKWVLMGALNSPPPMAGHSACIVNNEMIIFGGLMKSAVEQFYMQCSNDIWVLDLEELIWRKQPTSTPRPSPRYAQSIVTLDSDRLMVLGGAQTLRNRCIVYNDCWLLTMQGSIWTWKEITIKNKEWAAANIWCNPACRVGDKVVSLSRCRTDWSSAKPLVTSAVRLSALSQPQGAPVSVRIEQNLRKPLDRDQNINGKRGVLPRHPASVQHHVASSNEQPVAGPSNNAVHNASADTAHGSQPNNLEQSSINKMLQLKRPSSSSINFNNLSSNNNNNNETLRRTKTALKNNGVKIVRQLQEANRYRMAAFADPPLNPQPEHDLVNQRQIANVDNAQEPEIRPEVHPNQPAVKKLKRNTLAIHVLDISTVLDGSVLNYVSWMCPRLGESTGAPEELVLYSLVKGHGELIMFGGVHNDINLLNNASTHHKLYSNSVHFITPPSNVI